MEMKQLLCAAALCIVGACALAANNPGEWQCPPAKSMATQPAVCAAQTPETVGTAGTTSQWLAADAGCQKNCESRLDVCLKEAKTDAIRDKCKVYLKGCLKSCSQGK